MKKALPFLLIIVFYIAGMGGMSAQSISSSQVPAAVIHTFTQKFHDAEQAEWSQNAQRFKVVFSSQNTDYSALFDAYGNWLETYKQIAFTSLPAKIQNSFQTGKYKSSQIQVVKAATKITVLESYEIKVFDGSQNRNLIFTPEGLLYDDSPITVE